MIFSLFFEVRNFLEYGFDFKTNYNVLSFL